LTLSTLLLAHADMSTPSHLLDRRRLAISVPKLSTSPKAARACTNADKLLGQGCCDPSPACERARGDGMIDLARLCGHDSGTGLAALGSVACCSRNRGEHWDFTRSRRAGAFRTHIEGTVLNRSRLTFRLP
jgi:hypothetical protein